jgi:hypothetical protein
MGNFEFSVLGDNIPSNKLFVKIYIVFAAERRNPREILMAKLLGIVPLERPVKKDRRVLGV